MDHLTEETEDQMIGSDRESELIEKWLEDRKHWDSAEHRYQHKLRKSISERKRLESELVKAQRLQQSTQSMLEKVIIKCQKELSRNESLQSQIDSSKMRSPISKHSSPGKNKAIILRKEIQKLREHMQDIKKSQRENKESMQSKHNKQIEMLETELNNKKMENQSLKEEMIVERASLEKAYSLLKESQNECSALKQERDTLTSEIQSIRVNYGVLQSENERLKRNLEELSMNSREEEITEESISEETNAEEETPPMNEDHELLLGLQDLLNSLTPHHLIKKPLRKPTVPRIKIKPRTEKSAVRAITEERQSGHTFTRKVPRRPATSRRKQRKQSSRIQCRSARKGPSQLKALRTNTDVQSRKKRSVHHPKSVPRTSEKPRSRALRSSLYR